MKTAHTTLAALLLFVTLSAEKCTKNTAMDTSIMGSRWDLETLAGKAYKLPDGVEKPYIQLAADGAVSGFGGCNRLMGTAKADGNAVEFPGLGSTKMLCPETMDVERSFMEALRNTKHYRITGDKLTLEGDAGDLAAFTKGK